MVSVSLGHSFRINKLIQFPVTYVARFVVVLQFWVSQTHTNPKSANLYRSWPLEVGIYKEISQFMLIHFADCFIVPDKKFQLSRQATETITEATCTYNKIHVNGIRYNVIYLSVHELHNTL